jgi:putative colanic acid biosynthesis UDP-glucose lipid carrier transferase
MVYGAGGMLKSQSSRLAVLHRAVDSVLLAGSLGLACQIYNVDFDQSYWIAGALAIIVFATISEAFHLYDSRRLTSLRREAYDVLFALAILSLALISFAFVTKTSAHYSRLAVTNWAVIASASLVAYRLGLRMMLRAMRKRGMNTRTAAIAGSGAFGDFVRERLSQTEWTGTSVVGLFDDCADASLHGNLADLLELAKSGAIDYVYVALPLQDQEKIKRLIDDLSDATTTVYLVPDIFVFQVMQARWITVDGMPLVSIFDAPIYGIDGLLKRVEDLVLAGIILTMAAVPMILIAATIKLTSAGPVLFRQRRYGLNGKVVQVWKFRTMRVCEDGDNVPQAKRSDPRITPFGAFLRRSSLDELPQLLNVIAGNMSVVGPRPHAIAHNEQYRSLISGYMLRHKVKPGITGLAQVNGWRGETDTLEKMEKRVQYDLEYVRNWSLWLDLKIVAKTVVTGFTDANAY